MNTLPTKQSSQTTHTYSIPITNPSHAKGETPVYRHPQAVNGILSHIRRLPHITNLQQLHDYNATTFAGSNCLGTRVKLPDGSLGQYEFKTYAESYNIARKVGSSILNMDLAPVVSEPGYPDCRFVVVYERNCEEWVELDMACCLYGITSIPIFDVLGIDALEFIFKQTNVRTIFTSGDNIDILISGGSTEKLAKLDTIVCLRGYTPEQKEAAKKSNLRLFSWTEFLIGGNNILPYPKVTADTVFTLGYTSGTTGVPKGAIITHGNVIAACSGTEEVEILSFENCNGNMYLSYLPIAHIFERISIQQALSKGTTIGFFGGDILKLSSDLQVLKPNKMISVPRLYNKFYTGILAAVTKIAQAQAKDPNLQVSPEMAKAILQKLPPSVKDQFKMITGGKVQHYFTGSAPISNEVMDFLRIAFSAPLLEGYGQTETCSGIFLQHISDPTAGNMGPYVNTEFKLVDVSEMNYTAQDKGPNGELIPRGELCVRGPTVFKGYYKEPEKTAECTDEQGWHHTGDIAMLLPNGAIKLIDRRKNIFKLSQGEYIAPEKIENIYLTNKYVAEAYVHGDSFRPEIVAIVVPDRDNIMLLGKELGLGDMSFEELCTDARVIHRVTEEINKTGKAAKLLRFELAQHIYLEPKSFSLSGLTTPSMKLKRHDAKKYYDEVLTRLCNSIASKL